MKLRTRRMVVVPVLAGLLSVLGMTPAHSEEAAGGGPAVGEMNFSQGIPVNPTAAPVDNGFTSELELAGSITATDDADPTATATYTGPISVNLAGTSTDTAALGNPTVVALQGIGTSPQGSIEMSFVWPPILNVRAGASIAICVRVKVIITVTINNTTKTVLARICLKLVLTMVVRTTVGIFPNISITTAAVVGTWISTRCP